MTTRKRNEYLDPDLSDSDASSGYDSEAAHEANCSRTTVPRPKRQKLASSTSSDDDDDDIEILPADPGPPLSTQTPTPPQPASAQPPSPPHTTPPSKAPKPPAHTRGVIYLSRIPPFMRPSTVRTLLSPHGTITRLFLTPEPPTTYLSRKKSGGNRKHSFIDGWVEFSRRRDARICVESINGRIVGGKKGGYYRDDVWNARYLRGFTWGDLMEGVRREEREREERVRVGVRREGRERREFLRGVERGKGEEGRRRKREGKGGGGGGGGGMKERDGTGDGDVDVDGKGRGKFESRFRQNEVKQKKGKSQEQSEDVKRVLSKIF
jgi:ESF2/ABP1 family protein